MSVAGVDKKLPGSLGFYDLPLFDLLESAPISRSGVKALLSPYRNPSDCFDPWIFPNDQEHFDKRQYVGSCHLWDSEPLVKRGDFWGFQAIVGLVRLAESMGEDDYHLLCAQDMFRALPSVLREPWFMEHLDLMYACMEAIRCRCHYTALIFDVDLDVIRYQAEDPTYEPNPLLRLRKFRNDMFKPMKDPVLLGDIVGGTELHRQRQREHGGPLS